jgi:uncharacterized protein (DUF1778 family)
MKEVIRTADGKGRVALPGFANATVIIEKVDDTEYRVRKAQVIAEKDLRFHEEDFPVELSRTDAARLVEVLENPPAANRAARRAAKRFKKDHG